ncbi:hypothetical protein TCAL_17252 [Tigriopus californicus]|uniref:Uncharacterized protein n=1 Tax=Tigriopus californicus TaxID=6832 RepID=A0A553NZN6_TIGCA|nr:hypothetical protein TCAL_17252 [Tigriopus californicus]
MPDQWAVPSPMSHPEIKENPHASSRVCRVRVGHKRFVPRSHPRRPPANFKFLIMNSLARLSSSMIERRRDTATKVNGKRTSKRNAGRSSGGTKQGDQEQGKRGEGGEEGEEEEEEEQKKRSGNGRLGPRRVFFRTHESSEELLVEILLVIFPELSNDDATEVLVINEPIHLHRVNQILDFGLGWIQA